jgi:EPS-associated MarR family transcriptional regulator
MNGNLCSHRNEILMNHLEKEESLKILQEIHNNSRLTQRGLSSKLGISLGKVNFLLKALIEKGLVKASHFKNNQNKTAYLYILTPHGIEAKLKSTNLFLRKKIDEFEKLQHEIEHLKQEVLEAEAKPGTEQEKSV